MKQNNSYNFACGLIITDIIDPLLYVYEKVSHDIRIASEMNDFYLSAVNILTMHHRDRMIDLFVSMDNNDANLLEYIKHIEEQITYDECERMDSIDKAKQYVHDKKALVLMLKQLRFQFENARDLSHPICIEGIKLTNTKHVCWFISYRYKEHQSFDDVFSRENIKIILYDIYQKSLMDQSTL